MATSRTLPRPTGRPRAGVRPVYEDFKPDSEWKEDEDSNILLLIHLPGFQTRDLKVSTEGRNIIRVRGERLVAGNKWSRFQEDYPVPGDCIMTGIRAKFDGGILTITIPRKKKQVQEATPSTTIQPNPIGGHIGQPTPLKRVDDPTVLNDGEREAKDNQKHLEEKRPTLDPFQIRKPTPMKRANNEQSILDDHERETKDSKKLLEEKRPTIDPFQIRKPTPLKRANEEKRVLDDHERETKDHQKLLEEKRPTLDPFQIGKPTPMKMANIDEQRLLDDQERETKDHQKLLEEKRPTLDPFQIRKPTPIIRANEQRFLDDQETMKYNNQRLPIAIKPIVEKRATNQNVLDDNKLASKDETKTNPLGKYAKFEQQGLVDEHDHKVDDKSKIIHKDKDEEVSLKKSKQIEASKKRAKGATSRGNDDQVMGINYKKKVKNFLEVNEERQLLVNMGVAVLVLVALGVQISHTIGPSRESSS